MASRACRRADTALPVNEIFCRESGPALTRTFTVPIVDDDVPVAMVSDPDSVGEDAGVGISRTS